MALRTCVSAVVAAVALNACAAPPSPAALADQTTKAVYDVDVDGTEAHMDDELKKSVTRSSIGDLSDKMHALGGYKGLKPASSDADKGIYGFEADFDSGTLAVEIRMDPTGKIGAYRVSPASR